MDAGLRHGYERWRSAEAGGRDDEADAAFRQVFADVPRRDPGLQFTARAMAAISAAAAADARRARQTRAATIVMAVVGGAAAVYIGAGFAVSALWSGLLWSLDVLVAAIVRSASAMDRGADIWSVLGSLGRAAAAFVAEPKVTFTLLGVQAIAASALFALQRLLGTDGSD